MGGFMVKWIACASSCPTTLVALGAWLVTLWWPSLASLRRAPPSCQQACQQTEAEGMDATDGHHPKAAERIDPSRWNLER